MDELTVGLAGYVRAVAQQIGVPPEGTEFEVSDTVTAYLALTADAGRDLMLVWSDVHGWSIAVETAPFEAPVVLAHLGQPVIPSPRAVARFVEDVLAGKPGGPEPTVNPSRRTLAQRLRPYA